MSHPDPLFDPENVREEDDVRSPKAKALRKHIERAKKVNASREKNHVRFKKGKGIVGSGGKSEAYYDPKSRQIKFK